MSKILRCKGGAGGEWCWEKKREDCDMYFLLSSSYVLVASPGAQFLSRVSHLNHVCRFRMNLQQNFLDSWINLESNFSQSVRSTQ